MRERSFHQIFTIRNEECLISHVKNVKIKDDF